MGVEARGSLLASTESGADTADALESRHGAVGSERAIASLQRWIV